jgi:hypothetical protein
MAEKPFIQKSSDEGEKPSRQSRQRAAELHGPKPTPSNDSEDFSRKPKGRSRREGREHTSANRAVDVLQELLGGDIEPVVGMRFADAEQQDNEFEIVQILPNGNIVVRQIPGDDGGNYSLERMFTAAGLTHIAEQDVLRNTRRFVLPLTEEELEEMKQLLDEVSGAQASSEEESGEPIAIGGEDDRVVIPMIEAAAPTQQIVAPEEVGETVLVDVTPPQRGTVRGRQFGGSTPEMAAVDQGNDRVSAALGVEALSQEESLGQGESGSATAGNEDTEAIDSQRPGRGRRRRGREQTVSETNDPPQTTVSSQIPELARVVAEAVVSPREKNQTNPMSFEQTSQSAASKKPEEQQLDSEALVGFGQTYEDPAKKSQIHFDEELVGFGRTYEEPATKTPIDKTPVDTESKNSQYADGSVWVEEYLKEADQQTGTVASTQSEPTPAIVRMRNHPMHTRNILQQEGSKESDGLTEEKESNESEESDLEAPAGSREEAEVLASFGLRQNWQPVGRSHSDELGGGESGIENEDATSEEKLQQKINAITLVCDQARVDYVTVDNESRTVMSRLKGVLGISGKGIQNETVAQKKEAYQSKLRELRDLRLEMVTLKHQGTREIAQAVSEGNEGNEVDRAEALQEDLAKDLEAELLHFSHEVNIGLYNAWTELKSEQKGVLGKLKQFGESYNKISWKKKLLIGIPVAGLAVASGVGLLGTAMASAAIAAVLARRGIAAAGMFATADGGLQKLAESRAQKMAEKIVAQGQQEMTSSDFFTQNDTAEAEAAADEAEVVSPEANPESLHDKLDRMKAFMDDHIIGSLDQTLESRVRGQDRRRLSALAAGVGVGFGLPAFFSSEAGHEFTQAIATKAGQAASLAGETVFGNDYSPASGPVGVGGEAPASVDAAPPAVPADAIPEAKEANVVTPEAVMKEAPGPVGKDSLLLGKEVTLVRGDSVWKIIDTQLASQTDLNPAQKTYFIDALKNRYLAAGGTDKIFAGKTFNLSEHLTANDVDTALAAAKSITPAQEQSILSNIQGSAAEAAPSEGGRGYIDEETRERALDSVRTSSVMVEPESVAGGSGETPLPSSLSGAELMTARVLMVDAEEVVTHLPSGTRLRDFLQDYSRANGTTSVSNVNPMLAQGQIPLSEAKKIMVVSAQYGGKVSMDFFRANPDATVADFLKVVRTSALSPKTVV